MKKSLLGLLGIALTATLMMGCATKKSSSQSEDAPASSESSSEPEPVVEYTPEKVAADMNANLTAEGYTFQLTYDADYAEWSLAVNFGESTDESEENLKSGADTLASFLPDYCTAAGAIYGDPTAEGYIDIFSDNSIYYYAGFAVPDEKSDIAVISYIYNSLLIAQVSISAPAER